MQSRSIDVSTSWFADYLRSVAFLDAQRFPSIDFISSSVEKIDDHTVRVSGLLTMLGVTRPLAISVVVRRDTQTGRRIRLPGKNRYRSTWFGMTSGFLLVARDVKLVISSEAAQL